MDHGDSRRRRGASEWRRLIRAWKRSGLTAVRFAGRRGLSPRTLVWWRWKLEREGRRGRAHCQPAKGSVGLVRVQVADAQTTPSGFREPAPAWELTSPSGHALRVYAGAGTEMMRAVVEAVIRAGAACRR